MRPAFQILTILSILCLNTNVQAASPQGDFNKLRTEASEAVIIEVTLVVIVQDSPVNKTSQYITIHAKVLGVERSKSGLKVGDTITINYSIPTNPLPGYSSIPILDNRSVYPAFLNRQEKVFAPAANGSSFTMTPKSGK